MTDSFFVFLSAILGLGLINATVIINAYGFRSRWLTRLPIEVHYVAIFAVVLLAMLNGNEWVAARVLFPLVIAFAIYISIGSVRCFRLSNCVSNLQDGAFLFIVQLIILIVIYVGWQMRRYWLLEATNHDSLVYYQGMQWALNSPLLVGSEEIRARWDLGICMEGAGWIGFDCPLYRGGAYTFAAWLQFFAPRLTGSGLYFIGAYAGTVAWFAVRLMAPKTNWITAGFTAICSISVGLSTGFLGALLNSNLATVMGGASILMIVALAVRSDLQPMVRYGLMATWAAIGAHFYAESIFYSGLLICLIYLLELDKNVRAIKWGGCCRLVLFSLLLVLGFGNIAIFQAFSSLFLFGDIAKGGHWFSWYLHRPEILWVGSFVGGILMGSPTSAAIMVLSSVTTFFSITILIFTRAARNATLALIGVSLLAVIYLEISGYEYGEHKIIHLLGPAWSYLIVVSFYCIFKYIQRVGIRSVKDAAMIFTGVALLLSLALVSMNFISRGYSQMLQARGPHGLDFGLANLSSRIRSGETVLLDDSAWFGVEKFHKGHYLAFQIHDRGAQLLMPRITEDDLRGGYFRGKLNNKLSGSDKVDWLIQGRGFEAGESKFVPSLAPVWENADYRIYKVNKVPVAAVGNGWYDCEKLHCWTRAPFEIETYSPSAGVYELQVDFWTFRPPENGVISVRNEEGLLLARAPATANRIRVPLPAGWARLIFDGDWPLVSPKEAGMSTDDRRLFAAIQRVEIVLDGKSVK